MRACETCGADLPTDARFCRSCGIELAASQWPAGWHPDPYGEFEQRWWDGYFWTGHGRTTPLDNPTSTHTAPAQSAEEPVPAAGWYEDPWGLYEQRWWDGQAWTGHVNGRRAAQSVPEPPPLGTGPGQFHLRDGP